MRRGVVIALVAGLAGIAAAQPGGSADPSATGSGSAAGSGSASGPKVIQLPDDLAAPEVNASASPTAMKLGDRFTVFVTAAYGDGVEVNLREPVDLGSGFEIRKKLSEDRMRADGKHVREWQLDVVAWELGELRLPPIAVTFTVNGRAAQVETNLISIRVDGVLGDVVDDPKAMRDAHPPAALTSRDWFWLWIGAGAVTVVVVVIGVMLARRSRRRRTRRLTGGAVAAPRRIDMTSERALERLLAIEAAGVLARDEDRKGGYADMVDVIRDYVGARYRVAAVEQTSSELVRRLRRVAPADELAMIEGWLERCDLVKYGGHRASAGDAQQVLDDARALVVTTSQLREAAQARSTQEAA